MQLFGLPIMNRELLNSKLIYNYDIDEEFNIDTLLIKDFIELKCNQHQILEIGAGAGALSLYLSELKNVKIDAVEIQEKRFNRLKDNIKINNLESIINPIHQDVKTFKCIGLYDVIVTNPPFFKVNPKNDGNNIERRIAKEEIHLTLKELLFSVSQNLKSKGSFYLIYPASRLTELFRELDNCRLNVKRMALVAPRVTASPNRVLIEAVLDGKDEIKIEKLFYLYNQNGHISKRLSEIYNSRQIK